MSGGSETEALGADPTLSELIRALGLRIKSVEIDRTVSETESRVSIRIETRGLEDVKMAYNRDEPIPPHVLRDPAAWRP